ncbi:MAG: hypothetical protein GXP14_07365 [Gammaproteobacteria bacterium]|nr:hypothetical protein [Gammaproteobacteria bacterium]
MTNDELKDLRVRLKSGEYDGVHIMQAWIAIDELVKKRIELKELREFREKAFKA